jgi:hypothetical protein
MLYLSEPNIAPSLPKAQITFKRKHKEMENSKQDSYIIIFEESRKYLICNK